MNIKFKKDRVQIQNPKSQKWTKIDIEYSKILGYKNSLWKNIKKILKPISGFRR